MAALVTLPALLQPSGRCWRARTVRHAVQASLREQVGASSAPIGSQWEIEVRRGYIQDAVEVSKLLAQAFEDPSDGDDAGGQGGLSGGQLLRYQLKLLGALQWRASTLGRAFVCITATHSASGQLAGVASVTPGVSLADAADHLELGAGQAAATVSNMAVAAGYRRRGLGRLLLATCERAAAECYAPPVGIMVLAVYRANEAAVQLYESAGYQVDDSWMDPRWAESAERGRVGFARRQLMLKPLGGADLPLRRGSSSSSSKSSSGNGSSSGSSTGGGEQLK